MRWSHAFLPTLPFVFLFLLLVVTIPAFAADASLPSEAEALYQSKEYDQAAKAFSQLVDTTTDTDLKQRCLLRIGDCIQVGWLEGRGTSDTYYAQVLAQGYSPYLLEAFRKWRASYHGNHHGMTNAGGDPAVFAPANKFYNSVKERALRVIEDYLKEYPDDAVALAQRDGLQQRSDIEPGGPFGSSVLDESSDLWPEFSQ